MNEKLKEFLDAKKAAERKAFEEKKNETLLQLGLFEKVYSENEQYSNDFPYSEFDSKNSKNRWYKKSPIAITDEEYEEVKKYAELKVDKKGNPIAVTLRVIAIIIYIVGFVASFFLGVDKYGDISAMVIVWWVVFFVGGTCYLGFSEIIQLLEDIKKK